MEVVQDRVVTKIEDVKLGTLNGKMDIKVLVTATPDGRRFRQCLPIGFHNISRIGTVLAKYISGIRDEISKVRGDLDDGSYKVEIYSSVEDDKGKLHKVIGLKKFEVVGKDRMIKLSEKCDMVIWDNDSNVERKKIFENICNIIKSEFHMLIDEFKNPIILQRLAVIKGKDGDLINDVSEDDKRNMSMIINKHLRFGYNLIIRDLESLIGWYIVLFHDDVGSSYMNVANRIVKTGCFSYKNFLNAIGDEIDDGGFNVGLGLLTVNQISQKFKVISCYMLQYVENGVNVYKQFERRNYAVEYYNMTEYAFTTNFSIRLFPPRTLVRTYSTRSLHESDIGLSRTRSYANIAMLSKQEIPVVSSETDFPVLKKLNKDKKVEITDLRNLVSKDISKDKSSKDQKISLVTVSDKAYSLISNKFSAIFNMYSGEYKRNDLYQIFDENTYVKLQLPELKIQDKFKFNLGMMFYSFYNIGKCVILNHHGVSKIVDAIIDYYTEVTNDKKVYGTVPAGLLFDMTHISTVKNLENVWIGVLYLLTHGIGLGDRDYDIVNFCRVVCSSDNYDDDEQDVLFKNVNCLKEFKNTRFRNYEVSV